MKGTSLSADQINDLLSKGNDAKKAPHNKKAPHKKALAGLPAEDAKAVVDDLKTLK